MFLARKIARAKWEARSGLSDGETSADAVTGDLRTRENSLSFWRCAAGTNDEVEEAALAIAAGGDRIDRFDIVWLAEDELRADGQTLEDTRGRTPIAELAGRHVDVCRLDYVRLGDVARRVAAAIEDGRYRRLTKARVKTLLTAAVERRRIEPEDLADGLRMELAG